MQEFQLLALKSEKHGTTDHVILANSWLCKLYFLGNSHFCLKNYNFLWKNTVVESPI